MITYKIVSEMVHFEFEAVNCDFITYNSLEHRMQYLRWSAGVLRHPKIHLRQSLLPTATSLRQPWRLTNLLIYFLKKIILENNKKTLKNDYK